MELGLSLGDSSKALVGFMEKPREASNQLAGPVSFNTTLSIGPIITTQRDQHHEQDQQEEEEEEAAAAAAEAKPSKANNNNSHRTEGLHHHQLDLLPQLSLPWPTSENGEFGASSKGLDVNVLPVTVAAAATAEDEVEEGAALSSSPNSAASSFQMDLCIFSGSGGNYYSYNDGSGGGKRDSDEDDNGGDGRTRKKLRLSKEQSAYLEESFKEHNTLNPKQKLALAKHLHLRPRQVEVWFQNRRARTKLKQTEVDCEYLKRCCETLTEENRRLHKELQELRALKTSSSFYMQLPATTLTMCPSCERVASNPTSTATTSSAINANTGSVAATTTGSCKNFSSAAAKSGINESTSKDIGFPGGNKPRFHPFAHTT